MCEAPGEQLSLVGMAEGKEARRSGGECRGNSSLNVVGKPKVFPTVKKTKKVAYALRRNALVNRRPDLWLPRCFVLSHVSGINKTQVVFRSPAFITRHCLTRFSKIRFFVKKVGSKRYCLRLPSLTVDLFEPIRLSRCR
jgi:hypothetical protein